jgi:hypothetical protein
VLGRVPFSWLNSRFRLLQRSAAVQCSACMTQHRQHCGARHRIARCSTYVKPVRSLMVSGMVPVRECWLKLTALQNNDDTARGYRASPTRAASRHAPRTSQSWLCT